MLQLELQEGKEAMMQKEFARHGLAPATAVVLRLIEPWLAAPDKFHVFADAYFASVRTALELLRRGHDFSGNRRVSGNYWCTGVIKQGNAGFPQQALNHQAASVSRGGYAAAQVSVNVRGDEETLRYGDRACILGTFPGQLYGKTRRYKVSCRHASLTDQGSLDYLSFGICT
jgi:hypothetical protein